MTIDEAKRHPAYKKACYWCHKNGITGTMSDMDFGIPVMAYLAGYDKAKKEKKMREETTTAYSLSFIYVSAP